MEEFNFYDFIKNFNTINFCAGVEYAVDSLVDLITGVNYIFPHDYAWKHDHQWDNHSGYGWGYGYGYGGLSPRLNADGKPYVSTLGEIKIMCREYIKKNNELGNGKYNFHLSDGLYQITLENRKFRDRKSVV